MAEEMTICADCQWHRTYDGATTNHMCVHPDLQRRPAVDPVTGGPPVARLYDIAPDCHLVNDGVCKRYAAKREAEYDEHGHRIGLTGGVDTQAGTDAYEASDACRAALRRNWDEYSRERPGWYVLAYPDESGACFMEIEPTLGKALVRQKNLSERDRGHSFIVQLSEEGVRRNV